MLNYSPLVEASKQAIKKCFLANPNTVRKYGAAVLTKSGKIYSAGQYSSHNHITSIHAEMAAVILATMSGEANILALALSGENVDRVRSCGVCLQFLKEHCQRTKIDMDILFVDKDSIQKTKLSDLTEDFW